MNTQLTRLFDNIINPTYFETVYPRNSYTSKFENNQYIIKLEVPGLSSKDLEVLVSGDFLNINKKPGDSLIQRFTLPDNIDIDNISSTCRNGLLEVALPVIKPKSRSIVIQD